MADDRCHHHSRPLTRRWRKRGQQTQAFGDCRGGFTTKLHAVCDALGNPLRFIATGGERLDCTQAQALLEGFHAQAVLADKGYDADERLNWIQQTGAVVVIPPRSNRTDLRDYDTVLYKERNLGEQMCGYLKHFRRVATRYDKTAPSFLSFVQLAASYLWLKYMSTEPRIMCAYYVWKHKISKTSLPLLVLTGRMLKSRIMLVK